MKRERMIARAPYSALLAVIVAGVLMPGSVMAADVMTYYHLDAIGNVRVVTDQNGTVIERHDYLPFGEECTTGPCAGDTPLGVGQPRKFTGKERDAETGLDYFGARYYGSKIARFTTVDPFLDQKTALVDPQRWNRYAYGRNNPLRFVDPDGRDTWDLGIGFLQGLGNVGMSTPNMLFALGTDPRGTVGNVIQDARFLGQGVMHPSAVADAYVQLAVSSNDADQRALGTAFGEGTGAAAVAAVSLAGLGARPAAVARMPVPDTPGGMSVAQFGQTLMRWGRGDAAARARIGSLTAEELQNGGLTGEMASAWRKFYENETARNPTNPSAAGRADLMKHAETLLKKE